MRDCSVYTQRAYAIGLAHFFSWLRASGGDPDRVTRQIVGSYITEFARGAKQGAVVALGTQKSRQPRTINHRLSVLASYFEYCIRCDTEVGRGLPEGIDLPRLCACAAEEECSADLSTHVGQPRA